MGGQRGGNSRDPARDDDIKVTWTRAAVVVKRD